jgi:ergothioneine biosynthesis protein EgtB
MITTDTSGSRRTTSPRKLGELLARNRASSRVDHTLRGDSRDFTSGELIASFLKTRTFSDRLCEPLEVEDFVIQSMPEASPMKWHMAHTSWFFEIFILKPYFKGYASSHPEYNFLFNSYYNAVGPFHARPQRGLLSRPTVKNALEYRAEVDALVTELIQSADEEQLLELKPLIILGVNHEQQHQELMLTDLKHMFAQNPLCPAYCPAALTAKSEAPSLGWIPFDEGLYRIGHSDETFAYDNEGPNHRVFIGSFAMASRLATNREYESFIEDGGYDRPELWLSLGWTAVKERNWKAPLYWEKGDRRWRQFTLHGIEELSPHEPVCHVSYFEADAFARWAGSRLATEAEWELASSRVPIEGNFIDDELFQPIAAKPVHGIDAPTQMFGDLWEWTRSSYSPYPGYKTTDGALGEYNGKFMCNQYVLRGGSCATSQSHIRRTYRNFFPPDARWQFSGIRLTKDIL